MWGVRIGVKGSPAQKRVASVFASRVQAVVWSGLARISEGCGKRPADACCKAANRRIMSLPSASVAREEAPRGQVGRASPAPTQQGTSNG